jgi:pyruvate formate lyase activating enzyme
LNIRGLQKTSLLDFPGEICATLFVGGCNLRCKYCHNRDLVLEDTALPYYPPREIIAFLQKRNALLDGVCITGGEPTLRGVETMLPFLAAVKNTGLKVKLDTNGTRPAVIDKLLQEGVLDYIAVDIKGPWEKYPLITGVDMDPGTVKETVALLKGYGLGQEFRTTVVPGLLTAVDLLGIAREIAGCPKYVLQQYRPPVAFIDPAFSAGQPFSHEKIRQVAETCREHIQMVELRGF